MARITRDLVASIAREQKLTREQEEFITETILAGAGRRKDLKSLVQAMGLNLEEKQGLPYRITGALKIDGEELPVQITLTDESSLDRFQDYDELSSKKREYESDLQTFTNYYKKQIMKMIPDLPCTVTDVKISEECVESIFKGDASGLEELLGQDFTEKQAGRQERWKDYKAVREKLEELETRRDNLLEQAPETGIKELVKILTPYAPEPGPIIKTREPETLTGSAPEPLNPRPQDLKRGSDSETVITPPVSGDTVIQMPTDIQKLREFSSAASARDITLKYDPVGNHGWKQVFQESKTLQKSVTTTVHHAYAKLADEYNSKLAAGDVGFDLALSEGIFALAKGQFSEGTLNYLSEYGFDLASGTQLLGKDSAGNLVESNQFDTYVIDVLGELKTGSGITTETPEEIRDLIYPVIEQTLKKESGALDFTDEAKEQFKGQVLNEGRLVRKTIDDLFP